MIEKTCLVTAKNRKPWIEKVYIEDAKEKPELVEMLSHSYPDIIDVTCLCAECIKCHISEFINLFNVFGQLQSIVDTEFLIKYLADNPEIFHKVADPKMQKVVVEIMSAMVAAKPHIDKAASLTLDTLGT